MEAISNVATTASKTVSNLIYGQSAKDNEAANQEPLSGEQGKGTAKEPFDQGNEIGGQEPLSGEQGKGTAREPFDQGNAADNPVNTASSTSTFAGTSTTDASKPVDFLPLDPTLGKPSSTEAATETKTGGAHETGMPIIPLNPDVATMGTGPTTTSTSHTGITDNSGAAGKTYKDDSSAERLAGLSLSETPTTGAYQDASALDKETTKPAPSKEAAAHQESSTPNKESSSHQKAGSSAPEGKHSVSNAIDAILHPTPASEHSVPDELADAEHSKMIGHHPSKPVSDEHQRKDD